MTTRETNPSARKAPARRGPRPLHNRGDIMKNRPAGWPFSPAAVSSPRIGSKRQPYWRFYIIYLIGRCGSGAMLRIGGRVASGTEAVQPLFCHPERSEGPALFQRDPGRELEGSSFGRCAPQDDKERSFAALS